MIASTVIKNLSRALLNAPRCVSTFGLCPVANTGAIRSDTCKTPVASRNPHGLFKIKCLNHEATAAHNNFRASLRGICGRVQANITHLQDPCRHSSKLSRQICIGTLHLLLSPQSCCDAPLQAKAKITAVIVDNVWRNEALRNFVILAMYDLSDSDRNSKTWP